VHPSKTAEMFRHSMARKGYDWEWGNAPESYGFKESAEVSDKRSGCDKE
jgi:hypothetical protein